MNHSSLPKFIDSNKTFLIGIFIGAGLSIVSCIGIASLLNSTSNSGASNNIDELQALISDEGQLPEVRGSLEDIISDGNPSQRSKDLHTYLIGKDSEELQELIDDSNELFEGQRLVLAENFLFEHLAKINPNHALTKVWSQAEHRWQDLLSVVFGAWASSSLNDAVNAASKLEGSFRSVAVRAILVDRTDITDVERSKIAQILDNEFIANVVLSETMVMQLLHRPSDAWDVVLNDSISDDTQADLLSHIASAWISVEGVDGYVPVFRRLFALDGSYRSKLTASVIGRVVAANPHSAWEQAENLSSVEQRWIKPEIMSVWSSIDRQEAFEHVTQIEDPDIQHRVYKSLIEGWSRDQPSAVLNNLQLIPPEHRTNAIGSAISQLARNRSYDEATRYIQDLEEQGENVVRASMSLISIWSMHDPLSALNWLRANTEKGGPYSSTSLYMAIEQLSLQDPTQAIAFADANEFPDTTSESIKIQVIQALASHGRFERAKAVLPQLQDPLNRVIYDSLGRNLIFFDRSNDAIELAKDLPESRWIDYFKLLSISWFNANPDELVDTLAQLPNKGVRSAVAEQILSSASYYDHVLSSKQIEYVQTFLEVEE